MSEPMVDLKNCPFCGDAPRFIDGTGQGDCQIFCPNEYNGCPGPFVQERTEDLAKATWNRRPSPVTAAAPVTPADEARADALEEAAKVADDYATQTPDNSLRIGAKWISDDIRALKQEGRPAELRDRREPPP